LLAHAVVAGVDGLASGEHIDELLESPLTRLSALGDDYAVKGRVKVCGNISGAAGTACGEIARDGDRTRTSRPAVFGKLTGSILKEVSIREPNRPSVATGRAWQCVRGFGREQ
jgi:hypothetical protein